MINNKIFIFAGAVHAGKTTFMRRVCRMLQKEMLRVNGILSIAHFSGEEHQGYNALNIQTDAVFPLARLQGSPSWAKAGQYFFDPKGMNEATQAILDFHDTELTVIDEIGPLELQGKGFWPALEILRKNDQPTLIVVRTSLVDPVNQKLAEQAIIFHLHEKNLFQKISKALLSLQK